MQSRPRTGVRQLKVRDIKEIMGDQEALSNGKCFFDAKRENMNLVVVEPLYLKCLGMV